MRVVCPVRQAMYMCQGVTRNVRLQAAPTTKPVLMATREPSVGYAG